MGEDAEPTPPPLEPKARYRVGFCQRAAPGAWRNAQTANLHAEAARQHHDLLVETSDSVAAQIAAVERLAAAGVDALFLVPHADPEAARAVLAARDAGLPTVLFETAVDPNLAKAGRDYLCLIAADFAEQGRRCAQFLARVADGKASILELEGTAGTLRAKDRQRGFRGFLTGKVPGQKQGEGFPEMTILGAQVGNFDRAVGRAAFEALWATYPEATAVFAHNDEMALGAIAAIRDAGEQPGETIVVVSIGGTRAGLAAIVGGDLSATCEWSPRYGPTAFLTLARHARGEDLPDRVPNPDRFFDRSNARRHLDQPF